MERLFLVVDIPVRELKFLDKGSSSTGPKLLLNSGRSTQSPAPIPAEDTFSKEQTAKKFHSIYEKLSYEGFSDHQIECAALEVLLVSTAQADRFLQEILLWKKLKKREKLKFQFCQMAEVIVNLYILAKVHKQIGSVSIWNNRKRMNLKVGNLVCLSTVPQSRLWI